MAKDKGSKKDKVESGQEKDIVTHLPADDGLEAVLEEMEKLKAENAALKAKTSDTGKSSGKIVKMVWTHKKVKPEHIDTVFGMPAIGNEEGFLVVDVPEGLVKSEMTRTKKLIHLDLYNKRIELEKEFEISE